MNWKFAAIVSVCAVGLQGCGTPWVVMKAADPNPLVGQTSFVLRPLEYVQLQVDDVSEQVFLAKKDAESVEKWRVDKKAIQDLFLETATNKAGRSDVSFVSPGSATSYVVDTSVGAIETGFYRIPAFQAVARIHAQVRITNQQGNVIDEFNLQPAMAWDMFNPSSGGRLRGCAKKLGEHVADYVVLRVGK